MKAFMDQEFLLSTDSAKQLYHDYAEKMPVIDYHCHINPEEIAKDRKFENMTQVWLGGDHYKWRQMRSNGVEEKYITGDASDYDKFVKWAETLEVAIGNPLYHWSHLELQRYFGYTGHLSRETAKEVWELCNAKLQEDSMSVRNIIRQSNVKLLCTTDDPIDNLEWHKAIAADDSFDAQVYPTWRPDKAMNIEKPDFLDYMKQLEEVSGVKIGSVADIRAALTLRLDYFNQAGCTISDHGPDFVMYLPATEEEVEAIFQRKAEGQEPTADEVLAFKTAILLFLGKEYHRRNMAMQLHFSCKRNNNVLKFDTIGPDTGFDCINNNVSAEQMADFLNALNATDQLPRTILYSLNPMDDPVIGTIIGCFQDSSAVSKIQQGSAWWFNDHKPGMEAQMTSLASLGLLGNFIGMLTDSRSFLSYTRHEYFRRILCELVGGWVENGEYPNDQTALKRIIEGISYENAKRYFNFNL